MNTDDIPKAHPELLDALHHQDEQAQQMTLSEGFTEKVIRALPAPSHEGESLADARKLRSATPLHHGRGTRRAGWVSHIAAIFLAAVFLGGLAWAISPLLTSPKGEEPQSAQVSAPSLTGRAGGESSLIRFSDIRLDSILSVVSAHYGKIVCFRNEEPRSMKLITTWNPADSLAAFIGHLNMFDYLHLTLQGDTIFVESTNEEDE